MSKNFLIYALVCFGVICLFALYRAESGGKVLGGVVAATRTSITSSSGDTAAEATTSWSYINPAVTASATSTLVANIADADSIAFSFLMENASSTNATVAIRFQYSNATTSAATANWTDFSPLSLTATGVQTLATTSPYIFSPGFSSNASSTLGFTIKLGDIPATYVRAIVYSSPAGGSNFAFWDAFAVQRKGYNTGN